MTEEKEKFIEDNYLGLCYLVDDEIDNPQEACKEHLGMIWDNSVSKIIIKAKEEERERIIDIIK